MKKIEASVQKELVKWMRKEYPQLDIRLNKLDGRKDMLEIVEDKRMGAAIKGTPDITLMLHLKSTYVFELELKILKGTLNQNQKDWWANFKPNKTRSGAVAKGLLHAQSLVQGFVSTHLMLDEFEG